MSDVEYLTITKREGEGSPGVFYGLMQTQKKRMLCYLAAYLWHDEKTLRHIVYRNRK
jgi:hypothetical protein